MKLINYTQPMHVW